MKNNEVEKYELYEETNYDFITEEALEHIHLDPDQNFPYPKMKSSIMPIHHNDKENIIDDPEYLFQYCSLLISGHKGKTLHPNTIQVSTAQLY